jgi:hypothetical protein
MSVYKNRGTWGTEKIMIFTWLNYGYWFLSLPCEWNIAKTKPFSEIVQAANCTWAFFKETFKILWIISPNKLKSLWMGENRNIQWNQFASLSQTCNILCPMNQVQRLTLIFSSVKNVWAHCKSQSLWIHNLDYTYNLKCSAIWFLNI